jgi:hypothetical protein
MLSRKQLILVAFAVAVVIAVIVGAVVGTQRASGATGLSGGTPQASLALCSGEPCTAVPEACR